MKRPTKGKFVLSEFSEETKIASLLKLLPEELEQHVQLNKARLSSYSLLRTEVIQCAEELMAMEEYGRCGKGKGKGKDSKGKGKDKDSKGRGKAKIPKEKEKVKMRKASRKNLLDLVVEVQ